MRPALSRVPGVGNVEVLASDTREIEVIADPARLTASGLTIGDVADALQAANTLQPVGRYDAGGLQHLVLASGMWKNVRDIPDTPLVIKGGATIRVSDVATVQQGAPDRTTLVTGDGAVAANISVSQQVGSNILDVRAGVETALADLAKTLPAGLELSKTYDLAEFVSTAIANVRDAILIGSVLAVIVLLVFLRDWRLTLVASITLPAHRHDDLPRDAVAGRDDQRHVDGWPRGRHRARHRRRRRRGREHLSPSRQGRGVGAGRAARDEGTRSRRSWARR